MLSRMGKFIAPRQIAAPGTKPLPGQKGWLPKAGYLHPYACFPCRRSFKRQSATEAVLPCPHCGGPAIGLTRKFKPPKQSDIRQWAKVEALVRNGFLFWSLAEPYPTDLREVAAFTARHAAFLKRERQRSPEHYAKIDAAFTKLSKRATL